MPPNFSHQVSFSRRQFSLARLFFFGTTVSFFGHDFFWGGTTFFFGHDSFLSARLFFFGTTFSFRYDLFFLARLFFFGTTFFFWHNFFFSEGLFFFGTTFSFGHDLFFLARLFFFGTTFSFRHDFLFLARLFFFGTTSCFRHDFFYSTLQVTADLSQFHLIRKFNMVATECLKCRFLLFLLLISFSTCTGVLPTYTPLLNVERGDLIERYFHLGLGYSEILLFLGSLHGCFLSLRHIKRILKQQGLGRRRRRLPGY